MGWRDHPRETLPSGGAERDRTVDLRLAKPALSQLSYSPVSRSKKRWDDASRSLGDGAGAPSTHLGAAPPTHLSDVGQGRLELPTSRLSGVRSNHLSYWPEPLGPPRRRLEQPRGGPRSVPKNWIVCRLLVRGFDL